MPRATQLQLARTSSIAVLLLAALLAITARAAAEVPVRVVARTGDDLAALPGLTLDQIGFGAAPSAAVIDASGDIVFRVRLAGPGVDASNDGALLRSNGSSLAVVLRTGDPAPGLPGGLTSIAGILRGFVVNPAGDLAVPVLVTGPAVTTANDLAVYVERGAGLELLLREGDPVPGAPPGTTFQSALAPDLRLDEAGDVVLRWGVSSGGHAIVRDGPGGLGLVAITGATPPGVETGVIYAGIDPPSVEPGGRLAFGADLDNAGSSADEAIFSEGFGPLDIIVREGSPVPGMPGTPFGNLSEVRVDGAGRIAFLASSPPGVFAQRPSSLDGVVLDGDAIEGLAPGETLLAFGGAGPSLATHGAIAAVAQETNSLDDLVWRDAGTGPEVVVRQGDVALVRSNGPFLVFTFFEDLFPATTGTGDLLVFASLTGNGVGTANDESYWWMPRDGTRILMLREDDAIEAAPGEVRSIDSLPSAIGFFDHLGMQGMDTGSARAFNDRGELALEVGLDDASQALLVVPEPGAALGLAAALAAIGARARCGRRRAIHE